MTLTLTITPDAGDSTHHQLVDRRKLEVLFPDRQSYSIMSKKLYFCGSIRGGQQDVELYARIIAEMKKYGTVLTEHVGVKNVVQTAEGEMTSKFIHDRDVAWLEECDAVVAEVTQPSHGVGYEVGRAVAMNKRILLLFRPETNKKISCMIAGAANGSTVIFKEYGESQMPDLLKEFLV